MITDILKKAELTQADIINLLKAEGEDKVKLFKKAEEIKRQEVGNTVYFRGLIEFSNICSKDCYYCGIRKSNKNAQRYSVKDEDILQAVEFAHKNCYASVVLQSGEIEGSAFTRRIEELVKEIKHRTNNEIGITLSLGEQEEEIYQRWFDAGAHRYLLRIETTNRELFYKIHPKNKNHDFERRIACLRSLKKIGYQTGTGVMMGLPFQTYEDMANDLLFFKGFDADMIGMGPYIEHEETPLFEFRNILLPLKERFDLALKMIAVLRILMPDINIAAATALQAIDPIGREKAIKVGANVMMPNVTPTENRANYQLYENKPCIDEGADDCQNCLEARIKYAGDTIGYGQWGDSKHFFKRIAAL